MSRAQLGDHVRVQYLGLKPHGGAAEATHGRQVLEFTVGSKEVMPGISMGVVGMTEGEQKRMTLQPKDAYGLVRRDLIKEVSRARFRRTVNLCVGRWLTATGVRTGRKRRVRVLELKPDTVIIDGNHPQAGEVVEVEFQLISLQALPAGNGKTHRDARENK